MAGELHLALTTGVCKLWNLSVCLNTKRGQAMKPSGGDQHLLGTTLS